VIASEPEGCWLEYLFVTVVVAVCAVEGIGLWLRCSLENWVVASCRF